MSTDPEFKTADDLPGATLPPSLENDAPSASTEQEERNRRKEQKRLDALTWVPPNESVPVRYQDVELGHKTVQRNFNVWFVQIQIVMHKLQNFLPEQKSVGEEKASEVLGLIDARIQAIEKAVDDEIGRLRIVAKENDIDLGEKAFSSAIKLTVPRFTPFASRMLRVIRRVDELYWMAESLWIEGAIKEKHKWNIVNQYRKLLWTFVRETTAIWVRARNSLRAERLTRRDADVAKAA